MPNYGQQQDEYAVQSQQRTEEARKSNKYQAEIVPVTVKDRKGEVVVNEAEFPRPETSLASLSKLRPAFTTVSIVIMVSPHFGTKKYKTLCNLVQLLRHLDRKSCLLLQYHPAKSTNTYIRTLQQGQSLQAVDDTPFRVLSTVAGR